MRSKTAPSAANFLMYGASNLPPRICSKSLFSSTTMTMWSYTGSVEGQGSLSAAGGMPAVHDTRAMMHSWNGFVSVLSSVIDPNLVDSRHVSLHDDVGSATTVLSLDGRFSGA